MVEKLIKGQEVSGSFDGCAFFGLDIIDGSVVNLSITNSVIVPATCYPVHLKGHNGMLTMNDNLILPPTTDDGLSESNSAK